MKQQMKKILAVLFVILMAFSMLPGSYLQTDAAKKKTVKVTSVTLNKKTATIIKGQKLTLRATLNPKNTTQKSLRWSTSNKKVATVNAKGVVNGVKKGKATITVKVKGTSKKATCKVTVKDPVKVSKITMNVKSATIYEGATKTLKVTYAPKNTTQKSLSWSTSNKKVATVSSLGIVKGVKKGTATITATVKGTSKKATCKITVKAKPVVKVSALAFSVKEKTMGQGDVYQTKLSISPSNATNKGVTYTSSNSSIAMVDSKGKVTAKKVGDTIITATAKDGSGKKATMKVHVNFGEIRYVMTCNKGADVYAEMLGDTRYANKSFYVSRKTETYFCYGQDVSVRYKEEYTGNQRKEIISIKEAFPGNVYYGVYNTADDSEKTYAELGVKVEVWRGDTLLKTYQSPKKTGDCWAVLAYHGAIETLEDYDSITGYEGMIEYWYGDLKLTGMEGAHIKKAEITDARVNIYTDSDDFCQNPAKYQDQITAICAEKNTKWEIIASEEGYLYIELTSPEGRMRSYLIQVLDEEYGELTITKATYGGKGTFEFDLHGVEYNMLLVLGSEETIDPSLIEIECGDPKVKCTTGKAPEGYQTLTLEHSKGAKRTYMIQYNRSLLYAYPNLQIAEISSKDQSIVNWKYLPMSIYIYGSKTSEEMMEALPKILQITMKEKDAKWKLEQDNNGVWELLLSDGTDECRYTFFYEEVSELHDSDLKVVGFTCSDSNFLGERIENNTIYLYGKKEFETYKDQLQVQILQKGAKARFELREGEYEDIWYLILTGTDGKTREYRIEAEIDNDAIYGVLEVLDIKHKNLLFTNIMSDSVNLIGSAKSMESILTDIEIVFGEPKVTYTFEKTGGNDVREQWALTLVDQKGTKRIYAVIYRCDLDVYYGDMKLTSVTSTDGSVINCIIDENMIHLYGTKARFEEIKDQLVFTFQNNTQYQMEMSYDEEMAFWEVVIRDDTGMSRKYVLVYKKDYGDLKVVENGIGSTDGSVTHCVVMDDVITIFGTAKNFAEIREKLTVKTAGEDVQCQFVQDVVGNWTLVLKKGTDERIYNVYYMCD